MGIEVSTWMLAVIDQTNMQPVRLSFDVLSNMSSHLVWLSSLRSNSRCHQAQWLSIVWLPSARFSGIFTDDFFHAFKIDTIRDWCQILSPVKIR